MSTLPPIRTVLFDLDGTLADTAPDLAYALNQVLIEQGREPLPFDTIRPVVSNGGVALTRLGFDLDSEHPDFPPLYQRLLEIYRNNIARETSLFPGMPDLLNSIEQNNMNWGVVTNKPAWLTEPLSDALGLTERAACIVSGDTCEKSSPISSSASRRAVDTAERSSRSTDPPGKLTCQGCCGRCSERTVNNISGSAISRMGTNTAAVRRGRSGLPSILRKALTFRSATPRSNGDTAFSSTLCKSDGIFQVA